MSLLTEVAVKVRTRRLLFACLCVAIPSSLFADFQYTETTKITGGSIVGLMKMAGTFSKQARQANEPITSTIMVKGNRMARINSNYSEIVDLDKETITRIDNQHKTYTVMTFQQMKEQMEAAAREAKQKQREQAPQTATSGEEPPQMNFDVKVRDTGANREVAGLTAKEAILTMVLEAQDKKTGDKGNLAITNDMWMAPEIPGYAEVRDFQKRYALKMGAIFNEAFGPAMLGAMQPGSAKGMAELVKEMSKLKGTPVLQVMRMGSTTSGQPLPAASEAALPESNSPQMPSAGDVAKESATSAIASKLGGLGGFGGFGKKKKKEEPPPDDQQQNASAQPQAVVLIESNTELASFSQASVDAARFEVPAGYKQVEPRKVREE